MRRQPRSSRSHERDRQGPDARLARPLRQVHDLRDVLPGGRRHAPLPRARSTSAPRPSATGAPGPSPDVSLDLCSSCGICTQVCPQGVKIAEINSQARAALKADKGIPLRDRLIARPTLSGRLGTPVAPIANAVMRNRLARKLQEKSIGIHRAAPVPKWAGRTFQTWARKRGMRRPLRPRACAGPSSSSTAAARTTTSPTPGERAVAILEHNGLEVIIPKQGCCGLPLQSNGIFPDARKYVRAPGRRARALRAGRPRHRGHVHELRPDAEARGPRDPGRRGRRPAPSWASASTTSASTS